MTRHQKVAAAAARDLRYDVLFEPVRIGPVTVKNRFDQVPHCNGMSRAHPSSMAGQPDLWDVNISDWSHDSQTSRFADAGFQDDYVSWVKSVTTKPVVGVGRYTSPDKMVSLIRQGRLDMIGVARPSIADPSLPRKIEEGRIEDIRECIGCNICVSGDIASTPIRCTQNPTMGEEWRRGWHPERIAPAHAPESVLVVGAGPAGLEAARALGQRGYEVTLAEASDRLGGRVDAEARLPGLAQWRRVADHRAWRISQMPNVATYLESALTGEQVLEFGADHLAIATGSRWTASGIGLENHEPIPRETGAVVLTPDDIIAGARPEGSGLVVVFDNDHYYIGGVMAELLRSDGHPVTLAEATRELGGRVVREARLPGMSEYIRVRDWRVGQLHKLPNIEIFLESALTAADVLELAPDHVAVATGAAWRADRYDGAVYAPIAAPGAEGQVHTPDAIMEGALPDGPVVIFDQDGYYMAAVIAERLRAEGRAVTIVTDAADVAAWGDMTGEGGRTCRRLVSLGVELVTHRTVTRFDGAMATLACVHGGPDREIACAALVPVNARAPCDGLWADLRARAEAGPLPFTLARIGDCDAPGIVAQAVHAGHLYATELEAGTDADKPLRHERAATPAPRPGRRYLDTLLLFYEEEIMGEAYFAALAERLPDPARRAKMEKLAEVERHAAAAVRPLIEKYALAPRGRAELAALGRADADAGPQDREGLIAHMQATFPGCVDDFRALEAIAPEADLPALSRLTEHEVVAIDFLARERAARADSLAPLDAYLATPATAA